MKRCNNPNCEPCYKLDEVKNRHALECECCGLSVHHRYSPQQGSIVDSKHLMQEWDRAIEVKIKEQETTVS